MIGGTETCAMQTTAYTTTPHDAEVFRDLVSFLGEDVCKRCFLRTLTERCGPFRKLPLEIVGNKKAVAKLLVHQ